jgi:hypothetical protein
MSDPIGTVGLPRGASRDGNVDLFSLLYEGGDEFVNRVAILGKARDESNAALADLNLGKDAKSALEDAKRLQAAAAAGHALAAKVLTEAHEEEAAIITDARKEADAIRAAARAEAMNAARDAEVARASAGAYAVRTRAEADQLKAAGVAGLEIAKRREAEAVSAKSDHEASAAFHVSAENEAKRLQIVLRGKLDRLEAVLKETDRL